LKSAGGLISGAAGERVLLQTQSLIYYIFTPDTVPNLLHTKRPELKSAGGLISGAAESAGSSNRWSMFLSTIISASRYTT
jgi:hypothetical protein